MTYREWVASYGKYRWYLKDGAPRLYYPLPNNYSTIYDIVTGMTDHYLMNYDLPYDVELFTAEFFRTVPVAWLKWKTSVELFIGTLDGLNIDPNVFEAGYTRTTDVAENNTRKGTGNTNATISGSTIYGETVSITDEQSNVGGTTKARVLSYDVGSQAQDTINNGNIGELGNEFLSALNDTVTDTENSENSNTQNTTNEHTDTTQQGGNTAVTTSEENTRNFSEKVHETRINYYDNLAFLRERFEKIDKMVKFENFFIPLFWNVEVLKPW